MDLIRARYRRIGLFFCIVLQKVAKPVVLVVQAYDDKVQVGILRRINR
jgi:hypothetical protein